MRGKQTRIFHSISWFCNFTPEEKNHRAIRQNGRFSIFFSFVFFFSFFFFLCTLVIHPVKYHGTKYVSRRFILRRGVTVRSEVASHLLSARTRSFAIRNTNVCSGFSKKKKRKKKKTAMHQPWKRHETDKIKDKQRKSKSKSQLRSRLINGRKVEWINIHEG